MISLTLEQITDVSGLKWSELQLRKRMDQAIETKKQQERYVDVSLSYPSRGVSIIGIFLQEMTWHDPFESPPNMQC